MKNFNLIILLLLAVTSLPIQAKIKGFVDSVTLGSNNIVTIRGWSCDTGINRSVRVHFYFGYRAGQGPAFKGITANNPSESAVSRSCKNRFNRHRMQLELTNEQWAQHSGKTVYAYGISLSGGKNLELNKSGQFRIPNYVWGLSDFNIKPGADFIVRAGQSIVIDKSIDVGTLTIVGDLICSDDSKAYNLDAKKIIVSGGGRFICGDQSQRFKGQLNIRMKAGSERAIMATYGGELRLHGQTNNIGYQRLNRTAQIGSTSITLASPVNWRIGDSVVISSTGFNMNEAERVTITSISSNKQQISFSPALKHQHYGQLQHFNSPRRSWTLDQRAYVANLSRNIKISSYQGNYASSQLGAHMMIMSSAEAYIDGVEFINMGRLGQLGRYPFHWHKLGDAHGQYIRNSVIRDSFQRCIVVHNTNYATVQNNVCYNHNGHGIFLEEGNERKNVITHNLVLGSKKIAAQKALLISEVEGKSARFRAPASYWISNPDNRITDNVASGSEGTGFWMAFEKSSKCNSGTVGCSIPISTNTLAFDRNIAHSSKVGITWDGAPTGAPTNANGMDRRLENAHYAPPVKPVFNNLVYYKNSEAGVYFRGNAATFQGNIAADNRWSLFFAYSQYYKNGAIIGKSASFSHNDLISFGQQAQAQLGGILLYDGPFELENVDFLAFPSTTQSYQGKNITPIPFINIGGANRFENKVKGLSFSPEPVKRMFWRRDSNWDDETYSTSIRDLDGTLTGRAGKLVVNANAFNDHSSCDDRPNWQALVCDYKPILYTIRDVSQKASFFDVINPNGVRVRATPSTPYKFHNKFNTIRGSSGYYTMVANGHLLSDERFRIVMQAEGYGVLGPVVRLQGKSCSISGITRYSSLSALRASTKGGYYRDSFNTFFALKTNKVFNTHANAALSNVYHRSVEFNCSR